MLPYLDLHISMYGLCMAAAMLLAVLLSCLRAKKRGKDVDRLLTIALAAIVCGIIGAKVLYVLVTFSWKELIEYIREDGFLSLMQAGLVFYGGLIGGIGGAFLGAFFTRSRLSDYSDSVVPTLPLAHAIGRIGCFCAGCCYGRPTASWIGVCFPYSSIPTTPVIPTQLIESGANILLFAALLFFARKRRYKFTTLFVYLIAYGVERFLIEFLRGDEIRGIYWLFSTSQWISVALIILGILGLVFTLRQAKRTGFVPEPIPALSVSEKDLHDSGSDAK